MAAFNVGTIISTSVHEAYPGHYVQFLWQDQFPSKMRKLIGANTNIEGWAHYCEQMMLDEGYGQPGAGATDAREAKLIRLGQLQDALLRDARFIISIKLAYGAGRGERPMDDGPGGGLLCEGGLPVALRGQDGDEARNIGCDCICTTRWASWRS